MTSPLAIIVLNWNGLDDTLRCLKTLEETRPAAIKTEIILIDNGSMVDPADEIRRSFPKIDYVRLATNIGYAAGCNLGAQRALAHGAGFILFLNNDTVVSAGLLDALLTTFDTSPSIGIVSPLIREISNPKRIDFSGARINFALGRFQHEHRLPKSPASFETDYVTGCCMMISKAAVDRIGLFDEKLFAYFEDVDLCLRAQKAGLKTMCVPNVSIMHAGSASTRRNLNQGRISPLKHYLFARNRIVIIKRYASPASRWFHSLFTNPLRICFYVAGFILRRRWSKLRWFLCGISDGMRCSLSLPAQLESTP